jgi:hypothetical protein
MESKNDWYLTECKKENFNNKFYYTCLYSNGLTERKLYIQLGRELPTIMTNERLLSGIKDSDHVSMSLHNALHNSK